MEYIYSQTPAKSQPTPKSRKFDPYANIIDLSADSPVRMKKNNNNNKGLSLLGEDDDEDDYPILSGPRSNINTITNNNSTPSSSSSAFRNNSNAGNTQPSRPNPRSDKFQRFTSASQLVDMEADQSSFGASIAKSKPKTSSTPSSSRSYSSYIRPATGFARQNGVANTTHMAPLAGYTADGWPKWVDEGSSEAAAPKARDPGAPAPRDDEEEGEEFDIANVQYTAKDFETCSGDPEEQMRELLAEAVGDGEEGHTEGDEIIDGFAAHLRLMPHQVRGVRWMRERESGRRNGGILADDMGLGKTVQALARIVEGRHTASEKKTYKGGTLIVCPLAVMEQWAEEVRSKTTDGLLKVTTHHGPKRAKLSKELLKYDVVITTFQVLASEYNINQVPVNVAKVASESDSDSDAPKKKGKSKGKKNATMVSPLFDIKWLRIVIDEAQNIKNYKTKSALASVELKAKYRWCLTGTPIQNNVEELFSLFKFLRARPLDNIQVFRARVSSEVKAGRTGVAMKRLQVILKAIMLRRTKTATIDGKPILNLPERKVEVVECLFELEERAFYDALEQRTALTFNKFLKAGTVMNNYTSVLTMLLRLRQACDHPSMVATAMSNPTEEDSQATVDDIADELAGLMGGLGVANEAKCELCFTVLADQNAKQCTECEEISGTSIKKKGGNTNLPPYSTKIRKMLQLLKSVEERSGGKEKTIIFSQFTSFLNILEPFLQDAGFNYVRYDGSLRNEERIEVLKAIKTKPEINVILISFKAGSTGLNLTCCNNVILMDMWWNPALEDQAFDRAHRLGQTRDVNIWKLTIPQTVEDRILALQTQKRELADAALSGTALKNMKLTMADIMNLFRRSE